MGLFAVKNMRAMNASTEDITTHWLPSVRVLGDLRVGAITCRNVVRQHMLSETMAEKEAMEKTLATVVESNAKLRAQYEPMITSPEERALYKGWPDLWDKYKKGAFRDCGSLPGIDHDGCGGLGRSLRQCAVGRFGDGRPVVVRQRDQPPGAGIRSDGARCGRPGPYHQRPGRRVVESRKPDRRRGRADQRHRRSNQSAGAQRDHRGGACEAASTYRATKHPAGLRASAATWTDRARSSAL